MTEVPCPGFSCAEKNRKNLPLFAKWGSDKNSCDGGAAGTSRFVAVVHGAGTGDFCGSGTPFRPSSTSPVSQTRKNLQK